MEKGCKVTLKAFPVMACAPCNGALPRSVAVSIRWFPRHAYYGVYPPSRNLLTFVILQFFPRVLNFAVWIRPKNHEVVEDDARVREALRKILETAKDMAFEKDWSNAEDALAGWKESCPDVVDHGHQFTRCRRH